MRRKETGRNLSNFDRELPLSFEWQDMDKPVAFQNSEGFAAQVIYPTAGLLGEAAVDDPRSADAYCRAYNTWAIEVSASHRARFYPAAHISLHNPAITARELQRVAQLGFHSIFVSAAPHDGKSFGHKIHDPVWAAAQDLDLAVGLRLAGSLIIQAASLSRRRSGLHVVTINVIKDSG
jgi:predicted TIM-barrel fold metal-dependent hydrolase